MKQKKETLNSPRYDLTLFKQVGEDVFVSANVEIRRPHLVTIGNHVAIDTGMYLTTAAEIGDYIHIGPYVTVIGGARGLLRMGNFTSIAAGSRLICVSDLFTGEGLIATPGISEEYTVHKVAPIVFEDFVNVGTNAVIMPGVTLGVGSAVGACSLLTKDTEPWTIYMGTPARPVKVRPKKKMLEYAKKLGY